MQILQWMMFRFNLLENELLEDLTHIGIELDFLFIMLWIVKKLSNKLQILEIYEKQKQNIFLKLKFPMVLILYDLNKQMRLKLIIFQVLLKLEVRKLDFNTNVLLTARFVAYQDTLTMNVREFNKNKRFLNNSRLLELSYYQKKNYYKFLCKKANKDNLTLVPAKLKNFL